MSKIHFISGLPRSGSTLLANILAQNPRFHATATATSGILGQPPRPPGRRPVGREEP